MQVALSPPRNCLPQTPLSSPTASPAQLAPRPEAQGRAEPGSHSQRSSERSHARAAAIASLPGSNRSRHRLAIASGESTRHLKGHRESRLPRYCTPPGLPTLSGAPLPLLPILPPMSLPRGDVSCERGLRAQELTMPRLISTHPIRPGRSSHMACSTRRRRAAARAQADVGRWEGIDASPPDSPPLKSSLSPSHGIPSRAFQRLACHTQHVGSSNWRGSRRAGCVATLRSSKPMRGFSGRPM